MEKVSQRINPMVWFDNQAEEAAKFYISVFPHSQIGRKNYYGKEGFERHGQREGTLMTIDFELDGYRFTALNGGPHYKINPSISFFATYQSEMEVDAIWRQLTDGGTVLMPLDKYEWSNKYGWVQDQYGISWQIALGKKEDVGGSSIVPFFMFVKEQYGKAEDAVKFYTSVFHDSSIAGILRHPADAFPEKEGTVKHAQFVLEHQTFMAMESNLDHPFSFNEATSLVVNCETQGEIDYYWNNLSKEGDPKAQMCGWLKDRYGVSWQIVPTILDEMLQSSESVKAERVTKAYLKMKKFDIAALKQAFEG